MYNRVMQHFSTIIFVCLAKYSIYIKDPVTLVCDIIIIMYWGIPLLILYGTPPVEGQVQVGRDLIVIGGLKLENNIGLS